MSGANAVFEQSDKIAVVGCDIGWSNIATWNEFGGQYSADENKNNVTGKTLYNDTHNCIFHGEDKLIATIGVKDLIIADTADAVLVSHKNHIKDIQTIVDKSKSQNDPIYREFPTVYRPWVSYTVLQDGTGFKVKRIEVKPGDRLSLQFHNHRSEHWIVVSGEATVVNGDKDLKLGPNESTYIPKTHKHRLKDFGDESLILVKVQYGDHLGEDDIIRYDDVYNRI